MGLDRTPFVIPSQSEDWPTRATPRRAAVNSLGLGGTNAFAVLQQAPDMAEQADTASAEPVNILALSAQSKPALTKLASQWQQHLKGLKDAESVTSSCYSLTRFRKPFRHRLAVAAAAVAAAVQSVG